MGRKPDMTYSDILLAAADCLQTNGWIQGNTSRCTGESCAQGAIRIAIAGNAYPFMSRSKQTKTYHDLHYKICNYLDSRYGSLKYLQLHQWNDEAGRSKEQVIDLFHHLARQWDGHHA